jgi:glyoxylase-like metal-dependent hydrolase (beta-lactamase superfamily II)
MRRRTSAAPLIAAAALALAAGQVMPCIEAAYAWQAAQRAAPSGIESAAREGDIDVLPVQGNVHLIAGAGGNIAVQVGEEGVLLVDSGSEPMSGEVLAAIRRLSDRPIRYIVNTHLHADHIGGNAAIAKAGASLGASRALEGAEIIGHENVLLRLSKPAAGAATTPYAALPTATYFTDDKDFSFNAEAVVLIHAPAAHTDGDTMVFFRSSDVVVTGDVFVTTSYPVIDAGNGGTLQGVITALNHVLKLAVPRHNQEGGTVIVPGHGRLCEEHEVLEYRDMLVIIRDRIQEMVGRGASLEDVKRSRPTLDYDRRYGAESGPWTTGAFIEAIYRELSEGRAAK